MRGPQSEKAGSNRGRANNHRAGTLLPADLICPLVVFVRRSAKSVIGSLSARPTRHRKLPQMPVDHPGAPSSPVIARGYRTISVLSGFVFVVCALFLLGSIVDIGALLS